MSASMTREADISFVPGFMSKEDALKNYNMIKNTPGEKYEVQAIRFKELSKDCADNGFLIFILDGDGKLLEKIVPEK